MDETHRIGRWKGTLCFKERNRKLVGICASQTGALLPRKLRFNVLPGKDILQGVEITKYTRTYHSSYANYPTVRCTVSSNRVTRVGGTMHHLPLITMFATPFPDKLMKARGPSSKITSTFYRRPTCARFGRFAFRYPWCHCVGASSSLIQALLRTETARSPRRTEMKNPLDRIVLAFAVARWTG